MNKLTLSFVLLVGTLMVNTAFAGDHCVKTLMGTQCEANESGTSSHMRGNAVENAKASKALKEAKAKAKAKAISVGAAGQTSTKAK